MLRIAVFLFLFNNYNCYLVLSSVNSSVEANPLNSSSPINFGATPDYYDWRDKKMVSPVKNQLTCGACWAFSSIANIESHLKIYLNVDESLSEQFLIDCDEANKGCGIASILQTFANIVTKFGGVLRYNDYYPYAERRMQCRWKPSNTGVTKYGSLPFIDLVRDMQRPPNPKPIPVIGFRRVYHDEDVMADFIYKYGPLSAAINSASMAKYKGGIDEPTKEDCNPNQLNHAILIVGFNVYVSKSGEKLPYWIIKNSWGQEWGDNGFYYMVRGRNACGITSDVSFAYVN